MKQLTALLLVVTLLAISGYLLIKEQKQTEQLASWKQECQAACLPNEPKLATREICICNLQTELKTKGAP